MKYRKKPIVIEAVQWNGKNHNEIIELEIKSTNIREIFFSTNGKSQLIIPTLEGDHLCELNDFVIKEVKGELYPCKPDIFEMTYEAAE